MELIFSKIFIGFTAIATIISGILFPAQIVQPQSFGAVIPVPIASFTTSLASKIGIADTTLTLVSTTTDDGTSLINGTVYGFVLDVGTSDEEYILGTASSTNIIVSITRGISVVTGNTSVAALARKHGRGASVKITDAPVLLVLARILNGNETIPNALSYSSASSTFITSNAQLTNKAYVDSVTVSAGTLWLSSGNNIYNSNSGNVGISTSTPVTKLYVSGSSTISGNESVGGNLNVSGISNLAVTNITGTTNVSGGATFTGGVTSNTFTASATSSLAGATITAASSTVNSTNLNITGTNFNISSPTTTFTGNVIGATNFGGNGSNGDLILTGGTQQSYNVGSVSVYTKNFNNLTISGTSSISFTGAAASGTIVIFKVKGNLTVSTASTSAIYAKGMGANGQINGVGIPYGSMAGQTTSIGQGWGNPYAVSGWLSGEPFWKIHTTKAIKGYYMSVGAGGGNPSGGAAGGKGGGCIVLEVAGTWNWTTTSTIDVSGISGTDAATGGPGGGAGGCIIGLYNFIASSNQVFILTGGAGLTSGSGTGGSGGGNWENGVVNSTTNGGAGAPGYYLFEQNTEL